MIWRVSRWSDSPTSLTICGNMTDMSAGHKGKQALLFALHQLLSPYGLVAFSAFLTIEAASMVHAWYPAITTKTASWILTETPYFPVQVIVALQGGFAIRRFSRLPFGQWMWVLPLILLICMVTFAQVPVEQSRIDYFFGWGGLPRRGQLLLCEVDFTMPFYVAVAYSLGALLAGRIQASHAKTMEVLV